MAGSILSILVSDFSDEIQENLKAFISKNAQSKSGNDFSIIDKKKKINAPFSYESTSIESNEDYSELLIEISKIKQFNIIPKAIITFSAMINSQEDSFLLANFVLKLNSVLKGIIFYNGLLNEDYIKSSEGFIQKINFGFSDNNEINVHISDSIFLQNWIKNKHFKLIK